MTKEELKTLIANAKNYQDVFNIFSPICRVESEDYGDDNIGFAFWLNDEAVLHTWMGMDCVVHFYFQSDWYNDNVDENPEYYEWDYKMQPH